MNDAQSIIFIKLKTIMAGILKIDPSGVNNLAGVNSFLKKDLGIDSVESLDFLAAIESVFSITILDSEATDLKTVQNVIDLIIKKQPA